MSALPASDAEVPRERELVAVAARIFRERGYHGASIRTIAAEMGILGGSLYHYLSSKEDLLYQISRDACEVTNRCLAELLERPGSPLERLTAVLKAHTVTVANHVDTIGTYLMESRALQPRRAREISEIGRKYEHSVRGLVIEGQRTGSLRQLDPRVVTLSSLGMGNWVARWYRHGGALAAGEIADAFGTIAVHGLATPHGAQHPSATSPLPATLTRASRIRWSDGDRREREAQLLAGGAELFAQRGYHGTSLQAVADRIGIVKPSLFNYISTKEDLLFRIIDITLRQAEERQQEVMQIPDPISRLRASMVLHVNYMSANRAALQVMLTEIGGLSREHRKVMDRRTRTYRGLLQQTLEEGQRLGLLREVDPEVAALGVIGSLNWTYKWLRPARTVEQAAAGVIADMLLRGLAA